MSLTFEEIEAIEEMNEMVAILDEEEEMNSRKIWVPKLPEDNDWEEGGVI